MTTLREHNGPGDPRLNIAQAASVSMPFQLPLLLVGIVLTYWLIPLQCLAGSELPRWSRQQAGTFPIQNELEFDKPYGYAISLEEETGGSLTGASETHSAGDKDQGEVYACALSKAVAAGGTDGVVSVALAEKVRCLHSSSYRVSADIRTKGAVVFQGIAINPFPVGVIFAESSVTLKMVIGVWDVARETTVDEVYSTVLNEKRQNGPWLAEIIDIDEYDRLTFLVNLRQDAEYIMYAGIRVETSAWALASASATGSCSLGSWDLTYAIGTKEVDGYTRVSMMQIEDQSPDHSPPATMCSLDGTEGDAQWYVSGVRATLAAEDGADAYGVENKYYCVDGRSWQEYTGPFDIADDGEHVVEFFATDRAGNQEDEQSCTLKIDSTHPNITIDEPENGGETDRASILVRGEADDPASSEGSKLKSVVLKNSTNGFEKETDRVNGFDTADWLIANVPLDIGPNDLFAIVTDGAGNSGASKVITVHRRVTHTVTAAIDTVNPNSAEPGQAVHFAGHGNCSRGHDITAYEWKSSRDGNIGYQASFDKSNLSVGSHDISLRVKCSEGRWSDWAAWSGNPLEIVVSHTVTAAIDTVNPNPAEPGQAVHFAGHGNCSRGHDITAYEWKSSRDGIIGSQASFDKSNLSVGNHDISLRVQCSEGIWSDWVSWSGNPLVIGHVVTATIEDISPNSAEEGESVHFAGHGECSRGHAITAYEWKSSRDGIIGTQASFDKSDLSAGSHDISLRVQCSESKWSEWVSWSQNPLVIDGNCVPVEVQLARGWNLISLGQPCDTTVTFGELLGNNAIAVYRWDAENQEYQQIALDNPLSVLPSGYGVWVLMFQPESVCIPIKMPPDPNPNPVTVCRGWNLLGNPFPVEIDLGPNLTPEAGEDNLSDGYVWVTPPRRVQ